MHLQLTVLRGRLHKRCLPGRLAAYNGTLPVPETCTMNRPATPRKPRAASQARIATILAAARELLASEGVGSLSIYGVAERAQIPPSSVYHFFASVPALLEALTADVHAAFRAALLQPVEHDALRNWHDLSRILELRIMRIYHDDAAARQLILAQHGLVEVSQADHQHDIELSQLLKEVFDRHFHLPALPAEIDVFALAMELGDRVYARSMQQFEQITPRMAEEAMRVMDAYLGLYLPPCLPKRPNPL